MGECDRLLVRRIAEIHLRCADVPAIALERSIAFHGPFLWDMGKHENIDIVLAKDLNRFSQVVEIDAGPSIAQRVKEIPENKAV
jgi:hypothetical protein